MNVITVSQVNTYIKALLEESRPLRNIYIVGELSNFVHYFRSGHMYFTLKDDKSQIKAVMFNSYAQRLKFTPEDGMRVICRGRISLYEKDGLYQLYAEDMQPDGIGALNLAYEQLKNKLEAQGLFDPIHKKELPKYPKCIGVATSDMGAAIEDIKNITKRRYPLCELKIVPTCVQGEQAAPDIVKSIQFLDSMDDVDLIIVGRGGGSIEDLWAFNTEMVARAVYECNKPIISAVGHETDYTICDFAADLRAPTPSAAAELAVPDISNVLEFIGSVRDRLEYLLNRRIETEYQHLDDMFKNSVLSNPEKYFDSLTDELSQIEQRLIKQYSDILNCCNNTLSTAYLKLDSVNPLSVFLRGFGMVFKGNNTIKSVRDVHPNENIDVKLKDGTLHCTVNEVSYE